MVVLNVYIDNMYRLQSLLLPWVKICEKTKKKREFVKFWQTDKTINSHVKTSRNIHPPALGHTLAPHRWRPGRICPCSSEISLAWIWCACFGPACAGCRSVCIWGNGRVKDHNSWCRETLQTQCNRLTTPWQSRRDNELLCCVRHYFAGSRTRGNA